MVYERLAAQQAQQNANPFNLPSLLGHQGHDQPPEADYATNGIQSDNTFTREQ